MMAKYKANQITFRIDAFTPSTLPSARLAQYLIDLTALLGSQKHVYFVRLGKGSAQIIQWAEEKTIQVIKERVDKLVVAGGMRPQDVAISYESLNLKLAEDNAIGDLRIGREKVLQFPGRRTEATRVIGPIIQNEYLDGQLVRVGGFDETVPVHLREGKTNHYCTANVETAKRLGPYLYGPTIRVFGMAYWYRENNGQWRLDRFRVENFEPLQDIALPEAVNQLRSIPTEEWDETISEKIKLKDE